MLDAIPRDEVVAAVDRIIADILLAAGVEGPPVDAIALAQRHFGMEVCVDSQQKQRGRAQRGAGKKQIFLKPEPSEERHQWTVAHEIGEHLKTDLLQRLGWAAEDTRAMTGESLANLFAYHLLVPSCWFVGDAVAMNYDVLELKGRYTTSSHEVIAWRLLDLPEPCIITILDNDAISRRRSNAWPTRRRLEPVELKCQRFVHQNNRPRRLAEEGWTVQGWPVHQDGWQREILRSIVEEPV